MTYSAATDPRVTAGVRARWAFAGFLAGAVFLPAVSGLIAEALYRRHQR